VRRAYHLIPVLLIGLTIGCTHLQQARDSHLGTEPAAEKSSPAFAAKSERGTPAEAKAMLAKAIEHYNSVGRKQALADFNDRKAPFYDRDLYVFCISADGRTVANGGFPQYVGTSVDALKDADGKPLGRRILEAGSNREGSVEYRWLNPVNHQTERKISFAKKVGEDVCGVGAYNPE
jgi:cytochrome c